MFLDEGGENLGARDSGDESCGCGCGRVVVVGMSSDDIMRMRMLHELKYVAEPIIRKDNGRRCDKRDN